MRTAVKRTFISSLTAAVVGLMGVSSAANATPLPGVTDDYSGSYSTGNAFSSHGLWLPDFRAGATTQWAVTGGSVVYNSTAGTLDLTGTVQNNGDNALKLDFNWSLNEIAHAGPPACGTGQACQGATQDMKDNMRYFDFTGQVLTGAAGTLLDGLTLGLSIKPSDGSKPPQLGYGGNWRDLNFGYSNWFYWKIDDGVQDKFGLNKSSGGGDMNLTLADDGSGGQIPLPAAGWLLLAGLGALGAAKRRRKAA